jgi:hypothetical protein
MAAQVNKLTSSLTQSIIMFFENSRNDIVHVLLKQRAHIIFNSSANLYASTFEGV